MKVILYMAITVNGMIAKSDGDSDWVSEADGESFTATCRKAGAVIMGRKTYAVLAPDNLPLQDGRQLVLTSDPSLSSDNPTVEFTDLDPPAVLKLLEREGFAEVVIIGGAETVSRFMQARLIDEIYLDVEPLLLGRGIPLFAPANFEFELSLIDVKKLSEQTVQLHYQIK